MANIIVGLIVVGIVALAVKSLIKQKKAGGCGCGCENCGANCHDVHK